MLILLCTCMLLRLIENGAIMIEIFKIVSYAYMIMTYLLCSLTISYVDLCLYDAYVRDHAMTMMIMYDYISILVSYVD